MGSGSFPLEDGKSVNELRVAIGLIRDVHAAWIGDVYSGDSGGMQYDNAASDGGYLERLTVAIEMIESVIASD